MRTQFASIPVSTNERSKSMRTSARAIAIAFAVGACFAPFGARAFDSGSTGTDGAFSPTVNTTVPLPPSGIFNFTTVNIPSGVTVTFSNNTTKTPVVILASCNITIAGTINLNGGDGFPAGTAGGGNLGDDGIPGAGAAGGGFSGGRGGLVGTFASSPSGTTATLGGAGLGPGGGGPGGPSVTYCGTRVLGGAGGGFSAAGTNSATYLNGCGGGINPNGAGGAAYGSSGLLPLIGGSGGGGGSGGTSFSGAGGGGGAGAILLAATGTVNITGTINANGGRGGDTGGPGDGGAGGGGSGGAIRIVATTVAGNGPINAVGGAIGNDTGGSTYSVDGAGAGAAGRIRIEAEVFQRTAATNPGFAFAAPAPVFIAGTPTLTISSVAGVSAPATPSGNADITLPSSTPNPVTVSFTTTGVPVGNIVQLTVAPAGAAPRVVVVSPALTGSTASATASVSVNL